MVLFNTENLITVSYLETDRFSVYINNGVRGINEETRWQLHTMVAICTNSAFNYFQMGMHYHLIFQGGYIP